MAGNRQASVTSLQDYVYEGIWRDFHQPYYQSLTWTLTNSRALYLLAALSALVAFAQSRTWNIIRFIILKQHKSIRLEGSSDSDPLEGLSQSAAIRDVVPWITTQVLKVWRGLAKRLWTRSNRDVPVDKDCPVISPIFGVLAILNVALFLVLGVAIPFYLSEGVLGVALVRSRSTENCGMKPPYYENEYPSVWQPFRVDSILQQCNNRMDQGCSNDYYIRPPKIANRRHEKCVFPSDICDDSVSFEITHSNITPYDLGLNLRTSISINHRAPVRLDSFIVKSIGAENKTSIWIGNDALKQYESDTWYFNASFSHALTLRGTTNQRSYENIQREMQFPPWNGLESGPDDLTVLPRVTEMSGHRPGRLIRYSYEFLNTSMPQTMHQDLRRDDGLTFMVIYRAGNSPYLHPVDDPFFAAHINVKLKDVVNGYFYPDFEATALGCLEQFQHCNSVDAFCTPWGSLNQSRIVMKTYLETHKYEGSKPELWAADLASSLLSVHEYLLLRNNGYYGIPLMQKQWADGHSPDRIDSREQWISEVQTWFNKGIMTAILHNQQGVQWPLYWGKNYCNHVLFHDANYTNTNLIGLCITTIAIILWCIASFAITWSDRAMGRSGKAIRYFTVHICGHPIASARRTINVFLQMRQNASLKSRILSRWWTSRMPKKS